MAKNTKNRRAAWRDYIGYPADYGLYALSSLTMEEVSSEIKKRMSRKGIAKKGNEEILEMLFNSDSNPVSFREVAITGGRISQIKKRNVMKVYLGISEIMNSAHRLQDYEIYLRKFPYRKDGVKNSSYILHLIVGYNNEIYLLKQRCKVLAAQIEKMFRKHPAHTEVKRRTDYAISFLSTTLNAVVFIRGKHVHDSSMRYLQIERLETLELLMLSGEVPYRLLYRSAVRDAKRHFVETVKNSNKNVAKVINAFSEVLMSIVAFRRKLSLPPMGRKSLARLPSPKQLMK